MRIPDRLALGLAALMSLVASVSEGQAQTPSRLVVYCGVQEEWCRGMSSAFEKETGISVAMTRKSAGETLAQLKAEASNPRADVWWGGTGDPHEQAAFEGLTTEYASPHLAELHDWAQRPWRDTKGRTVGIYAGVLGFGYNARLLKAKGLKEPTCWSDLADPRFVDEVQMADPNASGTAYTLLATIVQLMGDDKGFTYLKALAKNVNQFTKAGAAPAHAVSIGETTIGITFLQDMIYETLTNPDVKAVIPCEGTGFEIGSMSIVKGARNRAAAERFYDWALTPAAQAIGPSLNQFQTPANAATPQAEKGIDFSKAKLISYDFAKYGSGETRKALLARWDKDVRGTAR